MAITMVSPEEQQRFKEIEDFLEKTIFKIPVPTELGEAPEYKPEENRPRGGFRGRGRGNQNRPSNSRPRSNPRSGGFKRGPRKNRPKQ